MKDNILKPSNGDGDIQFINFSSNLPEHGNEIEEIISAKQPFIARWGTVFFFTLLLIIGFICWIIKYPDLVVTKGVLNSINAPKEIITRADGKLVQLFVKEDQLVQANELLGYMENTADYTQVIALSAKLDSADEYIMNGRTDELNTISFTSFNHLGELQNSFQVYMQSLRDFSAYLSNGYYLHRKKMLVEDISFLKASHATLLMQKSLLHEDVLLTDSTFKANESLKNQKVISSFDYRNEKSKLLVKQMALPQIASSIISNESQQHEKLKEIAELENQIQKQKSIFTQALNTFKNAVEEWKKKYFLTAPVPGKVSFAAFLQENQQLKAGQSICFINPGNSDYYIEARIPQYNFGKVHAGQEVLLKFTAFPFQEFGIVNGRINMINTIPTDSGYLAKIEMPSGLISNYGKKIQYRTGLSAQVDIITNKKNLLQRFTENIIMKTSR